MTEIVQNIRSQNAEKKQHNVATASVLLLRCGINFVIGNSKKVMKAFQV